MRTQETYIHQLIEQFDFLELSKSDKTIVLNEMSEEAYTELRQTVLKAEVYFDNQVVKVPLPSTKKRLDSRLAQSPERNSVWILLQQAFTYRIPAYQIGIGVVLLFIGLQLLPENDPTLEESNKIEYVYQTTYDTIEKLVYREQPVERVVYVPNPIDKTAQKVNVRKSMSAVVMPIDEQPPIELEDVQKSLGNTKIKVSDLEQFRVSM